MKGICRRNSWSRWAILYQESSSRSRRTKIPGLILAVAWALMPGASLAQCDEARLALKQGKVIEFKSLEGCPNQADPEIFSALQVLIQSSIEQGHPEVIRQAATFLSEMYQVYKAGRSQYRSISVEQAAVTLVGGLSGQYLEFSELRLELPLGSEPTLERAHEALIALATRLEASEKLPLSTPERTSPSAIKGKGAEEPSEPGSWDYSPLIKGGGVLLLGLLAVWMVYARSRGTVADPVQANEAIDRVDEAAEPWRMATTDPSTVPKNLALPLARSFEEHETSQLKHEVEHLSQSLKGVSGKFKSIQQSFKTVHEAVSSLDEKAAAHEAALSQATNASQRLEHQFSKDLKALITQVGSVKESVGRLDEALTSIHTQHRSDQYLERAQTLLLQGQAQEAEDLTRTALFGSSSGDDSTPARERGVFPPSASGMRPFLSLAHPETRYDWGEALARHLLAEALLLHAAQLLSRADFVPARSSELPIDIQQIIVNARQQLDKSLDLRREAQDPKVSITQQVLADLEGGVLTRYALDRRSSLPEVLTTDAVSRRRDSVFVSYSRRDQEWLKRLQTMLKPLIRKGLSTWDDTIIESGADWKVEVENALGRAKIAILLVSDNFLASDFIAEKELPPLLEAARVEGVRILWVLISPCVYEVTAINQYQAAHDINHALTTLEQPEQQRVLADVCRKIYEAAMPVEARSRAES